MVETRLSDDLLTGADAIAEFMFGDAARRRRVYYLVECGRLPVFRVGQTLFARKSTLLAWVARQEAQAIGKERGDD